MKKNILIVYGTNDETAVIQDLLSSSNGGFHFFCATTAKEGMRLLRRNAIDVIFIKYGSPTRNGVLFLAAVRAFNKFRKVRIYLFDDHITPEQSEMAKVLGASGCFETKKEASLFGHELKALLNPQLIPSYIFLPRKETVDFSKLLNAERLEGNAASSPVAPNVVITNDLNRPTVEPLSLRPEKLL